MAFKYYIMIVHFLVFIIAVIIAINSKFENDNKDI